jgi:hypothetical protein
MGKKETAKELIKLLDDLGWDYDRMSSSGQITMDKIWKLVGLPTFSDVEENVEKKLKKQIIVFDLDDNDSKN